MAAAHTSLPVIGVPVKATHLDGVDSMHSIVQMPRGVPVAGGGVCGGGAEGEFGQGCEVACFGVEEVYGPDAGEEVVVELSIVNDRSRF